MEYWQRQWRTYLFDFLKVIVVRSKVFEILPALVESTKGLA
jgi:hypothetical protein